MLFIDDLQRKRVRSFVSLQRSVFELLLKSYIHSLICSKVNVFCTWETLIMQSSYTSDERGPTKMSYLNIILICEIAYEVLARDATYQKSESEVSFDKLCQHNFWRNLPL